MGPRLLSHFPLSWELLSLNDEDLGLCWHLGADTSVCTLCLWPLTGLSCGYHPVPVVLGSAEACVQNLQGLFPYPAPSAAHPRLSFPVSCFKTEGVLQMKLLPRSRTDLQCTNNWGQMSLSQPDDFLLQKKKKKKKRQKTLWLLFIGLSVPGLQFHCAAGVCDTC